MKRIFAAGKRACEFLDTHNDDVQQLKDAQCDPEEHVTFLSPLVRSMITIIDNDMVHGTDKTEEYVTEDGLLNWTEFSVAKMTDDCVERDEVSLFISASNYLRRVLHQHLHPFALSTFKNNSVENIVKKYGALMTILPEVVISSNSQKQFEHFICPQNALFLEVLHLYRSSKYQLCFSTCITFLERTISDLMHKSQQQNTRPMKINNLLQLEELVSLLGPDVIFMLRLVCGPLQGMNFRNLLWHGFFSDDEFEPVYASLLLLLVVSIADIPGILQSLITRPPLQDISRFDKPIDTPDFGNYIEDIVDNCYIIPSCQRALWKESLRHHVDHEYYYCAVTLFPLIEHALRRMFVHVNDRENHVLSAETQAVYITFDHIFSNQIGPQLMYNYLFDEIDVPTMLCLHDVIVWGPKLRDRLSHGLVDPTTIPRSLVDRLVVSALMLLCGKYRFKSTNDFRISYDYTPVYHPQTFFFEEMKCTASFIKNFFIDCVFDLLKYDDTSDMSPRTVLLNPDLRGQVLLIIDQMDEHILIKTKSRGSAYNFHVVPFVEVGVLDYTFLPYQVPKMYGLGIRGGNIPAIDVCRRVTIDVRESIVAVDEMMNKMRVFKDKKRGQAHIEKFQRNMYSLYLLLVLMMRGVEVAMIRVCLPGNMELCEILLDASISLKTCIIKNDWIKPKIINKLIVALRAVL
ncbi:ER membrane-associated RNA degradation protein [Acrasis kona]|uniref:ER membrane-associated RNA degradation protein n=1 Tax=Acrasis kona TaxID=1008807 RepID=A0AAW2Z830_9EUKA